jgi:hypothetical protein
MWSACSLFCVLLLLLSSASLAKVSVSEGPDLEVKTRVGARVVDRPLPTASSFPGDDDTPDRGGPNGEDELKFPMAAKDGGLSNGLKDLWANLRLHLLTVLRVWK